MNLTLAERLLYSTVRIEGFKEGKPVGTGTGFFWTIPHGPMTVSVIVTNKHVIADCDQVFALVHTAMPGKPGQPSGGTMRVTLLLGPRGVTPHPDPEVDLIAFGVAALADQVAAVGNTLFHGSLLADTVPTPEEWKDFDAIEEVIMIGYPRGIADEKNNRPIVRRGITATALGTLYDGRPEFMVDMACFPGSSGSPVFMLQHSGTDRATGKHVIGVRRFFFLGVLHSGPVVTQSGEIHLGGVPTVSVAAMMHLGQVLRSTRMLELEAAIRPFLPPFATH